jgi:uncharacterized membrane protein
MTEEHADTTPAATAATPATSHNGMAHVLAGIQSLHDRLEAIEDLARSALDDGTPGAPGAPRVRVPSWRRPTDGEARWQVTLATAAGIALQLPVYGRAQLVRPFWVLPAVQGLLLVGIVAANPRRINRESRMIRSAALALAALLSVANAWAAASLVSDIVRGKGPGTAGPLLVTGGAIWLTNVVVFALWYWEFDQGGPVARALATKPRYPDFLFANMTVSDNPDLSPRDWKPAFSDYLYLAFTNATAFSPTDTLPLSRWAKMAMTLQSLVSLITVALVVARAINVLPS